MVVVMTAGSDLIWSDQVVRTKLTFKVKKSVAVLTSGTVELIPALSPRASGLPKVSATSHRGLWLTANAVVM